MLIKPANRAAKFNLLNSTGLLLYNSRLLQRYRPQ